MLLLRRLRLLLPLLALLLRRRLLPIGRSLARGRRHVGAALRRARRPVAETPALAGRERLRRLHLVGRAHDVSRRAKRSLRTEVAAAQILRPYLHGACNRRGAGEHRRPHGVTAKRPPLPATSTVRFTITVSLMKTLYRATGRITDAIRGTMKSGPRTKIQYRGSSTYSTTMSSGGNGDHPT